MGGGGTKQKTFFNVMGFFLPTFNNHTLCYDFSLLSFLLPDFKPDPLKMILRQGMHTIPEAVKISV